MGHILVAISIVEQIHGPSAQFRTVPNTVEILVTSTFIAVATDSKESMENSIEPEAPVEHEEDICNICIVGEIVTPVKVFWLDTRMLRIENILHFPCSIVTSLLFHVKCYIN